MADRGQPRRRSRRKGATLRDGERRQLARASRQATAPTPASPGPADCARLLCDGGSRGNPGPAAVAAVLVGADGTPLDSAAQPIGRATAAEAEYRAILLGLELARRHGADPIEVRSDSRLAIDALERGTTVHDALEAVVGDVRAAASAFAGVRWRWHPSGANEAADALVRGLLWPRA